MEKIKIYIASPYTIGDQINNVRTQMIVFETLHSFGMMPFAPLWGSFQNLVFPYTREEWLEWCSTWVKSCDCLLRLPGESKGADEEVRVAIMNSIPVYYSIDQVKEAFISGRIHFLVSKKTN